MRTARCLSIFLFGTTLLYAAKPNSVAPVFSLMDNHHQKRTLGEYKGKIVFINFWASWCAPCAMELPELNRLAANYKDKKVKVLAINVDQDPADAEKILTKLGLKNAAFEILWDARSKVVSAYNIDAMPSSFIIDKEGVVRFIHTGFHHQDPETWRQEIDSLK